MTKKYLQKYAITAADIAGNKTEPKNYELRTLLSKNKTNKRTNRSIAKIYKGLLKSSFKTNK